MPLSPETLQRNSRIASYLLSALGVLAVFRLGLLAPLLFGLLTHQLIHLAAPRLSAKGWHPSRGKIAAVALLSALIASIVSGIAYGVAWLVRDPASLPALLSEMARVLESTRAALPASIAAYVPSGSADELRLMALEWLQPHSKELSAAGGETLHILVRSLLAIVIGAMLAIREASSDSELAPFAAALAERISRLASAFRSVVFAQIRISAINTALTAAYLLGLLPLLGVELPLAKTLVLATFLFGLVPVLGNLASNSAIFVISLSVSPQVAFGSLAYLIVIHKLEYFLNARIIGGQVNARAWEILLAMVCMEAAFGVPGAVFAPILYAWAKSELSAKGLV